jgi:hypothetical protein
LSEKGGELQKATEQAFPIAGAVSSPQIFIKISTVHNRGHILAATQVVMFNGYFRASDSYPENTGQGILQGSCQQERTFYRMSSAKEEGQLSGHLAILPKI